MVTHSTYGWRTDEIMVDYLNWLKNQASGNNLCLVIDVFSAYITPLVKTTAKDLGIELIYVPANGTGLYQPCDIRIMGVLKKKSIAAWELDRRKSLDSNVWNKAKAALACSRILTSQIDASVVGSAWDSIAHLNDIEFIAAEFDSNVDVSEEEGDEYQ